MSTLARKAKRDQGQINSLDFAVLAQIAEAVDAFASDPLVEKTLGTALRDEFIRYKRAEWEEYHQHVSDWEIKRYGQFF